MDWVLEDIKELWILLGVIIVLWLYILLKFWAVEDTTLYSWTHMMSGVSFKVCIPVAERGRGETRVETRWAKCWEMLKLGHGYMEIHYALFSRFVYVWKFHSTFLENEMEFERNRLIVLSQKGLQTKNRQVDFGLTIYKPL